MEGASILCFSYRHCLSAVNVVLTFARVYCLMLLSVVFPSNCFYNGLLTIVLFVFLVLYFCLGSLALLFRFSCLFLSSWLPPCVPFSCPNRYFVPFVAIPWFSFSLSAFVCEFVFLFVSIACVRPVLYYIYIYLFIFMCSCSFLFCILFSLPRSLFRHHSSYLSCTL